MAMTPAAHYTAAEEALGMAEQNPTPSPEQDWYIKTARIHAILATVPADNLPPEVRRIFQAS